MINSYTVRGFTALPAGWYVRRLWATGEPYELTPCPGVLTITEHDPDAGDMLAVVPALCNSQLPSGELMPAVNAAGVEPLQLTLVFDPEAG